MTQNLADLKKERKADISIEEPRTTLSRFKQQKYILEEEKFTNTHIFIKSVRFVKSNLHKFFKSFYYS